MQHRFSTPTVITSMVIAAMVGSGFSAVASANTSAIKAQKTTTAHKVAAKPAAAPETGATGNCGPGDHDGHGGPGGPPFMSAVKSYLGVTDVQIQMAFSSGKTLADLATANGKTAEGLEAAIVADAKTHLAADVNAGKLTQAQADARLADLSSHVVDVVTKTPPPHPADGGRPAGPPPTTSTTPAI